MPFLLKLLDNPDENIRYDATIGIAQYAMSFPVAKAGHKVDAMSAYKADQSVTNEIYRHYPAMDLFAKDEGEYISYWKDWLNSHPVQ